jgi:hypothetical protein
MSITAPVWRLRAVARRGRNWYVAHHALRPGAGDVGAGHIRIRNCGQEDTMNRIANEQVVITATAPGLIPATVRTMFPPGDARQRE